MLDAVFERAPVGLALYDRDLRLMRVNDHLAAINGPPAEEQIGRTVAELVPDVAGVEATMRGVLATGRSVEQHEVTGSTSAAPGVARTFDVSFWPVRRGGNGEILGVGCVVFEVTERRAAENALREQTARYESLLRALSEVGEGMIHVPAGATGWLMPQQPAVRVRSRVRGPLSGGQPPARPRPRPDGWSFPALFKTPAGKWLLITEAALDDSYCGSHLAQDAAGGVYRLKFPDPKEGLGVGEVEPDVDAALDDALARRHHRRRRRDACSNPIS